MRRALLRELEGTCIMHSKFDKVPYEYSTIVGIEEFVHEILMNLKKNVFRIILMEPIDLCIELNIERGRGYCVRTPNNYEDMSYPIDAIYMPVRNANHSIYSYENENEK
ncbi:unnamed protein product [Victoria cruziana]